jgi:hypothetical protein
VVEEQNADGLPPHFRDQFTLHRFLGDQSHGPAGTAFGRVAAYHRNNTLPLALLQKRLRSWPLLVIKGAVQARFFLAVSDLPDGLRSQLHLGRNF